MKNVFAILSLVLFASSAFASGITQSKAIEIAHEKVETAAPGYISFDDGNNPFKVWSQKDMGTLETDFEVSAEARVLINENSLNANYYVEVSINDCVVRSFIEIVNKYSGVVVGQLQNSDGELVVYDPSKFTDGNQ